MVFHHSTEEKEAIQVIVTYLSLIAKVLSAGDQWAY